MRQALALVILIVGVACSAAAQVAPFAGGAGSQMPDPKQISGVPLPVGDLPVGTVTVRVVRGSMANPLKGETVTLSAGGATKSAVTDQDGHATFSGLTPGTQVKASATVAGEALESQQFEVAANGGIRVALVATDPEMAKKAEEDRRLAQEPAVAGTVVLGDQSRIVIELGEDGINVFNLFQVVNTARRPVKTAAPLVFNVPSDAVGLGMLQDSTKSAVAGGHAVTVTGPFAPGSTNVQFAYTLPFGGDTIGISQTIPVQMPQFAVLLQTEGTMNVTSPQIVQRRQMTADGQSYVLGQGPAVPAGGTISLTLTGMPHAPVWPRNVGLALASLVLVGGAWAATRRSGSGEDPRRSRLLSRRERLLNDLTALERERRQGTVAEADYAARRRELVDSLERIYAELGGEAAA
jgi:hypothetical protein